MEESWTHQYTRTKVLNALTKRKEVVSQFLNIERSEVHFGFDMSEFDDEGQEGVDLTSLALNAMQVHDLLSEDAPPRQNFRTNLDLVNDCDK